MEALQDLMPYLYHHGLQPQDFPIRIIFSAVLGVIIGFNRQIRTQTAGIRTFALILIGSCVAMLCSIYVPDFIGMGDHTRIAAQVVSGVGFLGAGAILRGRGFSIQGMTTAALIWVSAVLGLAVGAGLYISSLIITAVLIFVLIGLQPVKDRINTTKRNITISFDTDQPNVRAVLDLITKEGILVLSHFLEVDYEKKNSKMMLSLQIPRGGGISTLHDDLRGVHRIKKVMITDR